MKRLLIAMLLICALSVNALAAYPSEVTHEERDGFRYINKTFIVNPGDDPDRLEKAPFELFGYSYSMFSIAKEEIIYEDHRDHTEILTVETSSKDLEDVLAALPPTVEYNTDGYTGTLSLKHTTIKTDVSGYSSKSYSLKDTKTFPNLDRNDPSYIPKTSEKSGVSLALSNIDWSVDAVDGDLNPISYSATAYYSGGYTGRVADGYTTTAEYAGIIETRGISSIIYTVTYIGQEIVPDPMPDMELQESGSLSQVIIISMITAMATLLIIAGVITALWLTKRNVRICRRNEETGALILLAKRRVSVKKPVIDTNGLEQNDNELIIGLDAAVADKLSWKEITVKLETGSRTHLVEKVDSGAYWFSVSPFENFESNYERAHEI